MSSDELIEEGKRAIRQDRIREEIIRNDEKDESKKFAKQGTLKEGYRGDKTVWIISNNDK